MLLHVASPLISNPTVLRTQKLLGDVNNVSKFGDFRPGAIDGEFGPATAGAAKRAKYWLGYPAKQVKPTAGDTLRDFLSGRKKLPLRYRLRRKRRLARHADKPLREKALETARSQLGVKESPANSNRVKYSEWYGMIGPWCAMFVTWCYVQRGSKGFAKGSRYAYCPYMVNAIKNQQYGFRRVSASEVKPGDIVLYDWDGGVADHVGLFESWKVKGSVFYAIEGNTSLTSNSNGGQVMRRERYVSQVEVFGRQEQ